ncbi:MgtC/SapB family protein [Bacillus sp. FJAT-47783]|uniref:MgtC/SapB family protein n=1 Tax=Bacillus sp. FJAT-47783 TaxID=2922712 RepID=UPI001FADB214|nr:MgtC/SapB family protein [Bacillus sp. FJAT-47783]
MFHEWEIMLLRLVVAALLSGFIGLEREAKRHPAGFRTHLLVGVGSCLMMLLSLYGFNEYIESSNQIQYDPARIPSYVISGIGFLGAGTILVKGATVRGLTTAASIWVVAGLGLVIGSGMYVLAVFVTIIVLLSLIFLNKMESIILKKSNERLIKAVLHEGELNKFVYKLESMKVTVDRINLTNRKRNKNNEEVMLHYVIKVTLKEKSEVLSLIDQITKVNGVEKVF